MCARRAAPAADHPLGPVSCACVPAVPVGRLFRSEATRRNFGESFDVSGKTAPAPRAPLSRLRRPATRPVGGGPTHPGPGRPDPRAPSRERLRVAEEQLEIDTGESDTDRMRKMVRRSFVFDLLGNSWRFFTSGL